MGQKINLPSNFSLPKKNIPHKGGGSSVIGSFVASIRKLAKTPSTIIEVPKENIWKILTVQTPKSQNGGSSFVFITFQEPDGQPTESFQLSISSLQNMMHRFSVTTPQALIDKSFTSKIKDPNSLVYLLSARSPKK